MDDFGLVFVVVWVALAIVIIAGQWRKNLRVSGLKRQVRSQPVTYATPARVRSRTSAGAWVDFRNGFGRCQLLVRDRDLEVSLAGSTTRLGDFLGASRFMHASQTRMWVDQLGWLGTRIARRPCIRLSTEDDNGIVELAISPDSDIDEVWTALREAGVSPVNPPH